MDLLQPPAATAFDAVSALISASVYLLVALAAIARAPRDPRTRVFLAIAIASAAPYCVTALIWRDGSRALWSKTLIVSLALSLMIGSLTLLHFSQVFPWRRPWIRKHAAWLWFGYAGVLVITALAAFLTPSLDSLDGGLGAVSPEFALTTAVLVIVVVIPLLFILGIATPFAGLLSLYKSWLTAKGRQIGSARITVWWMLVSQMGGGVLTILIIPLLRLIAPRGPWVTIAAALLFGFSLLMPIAFAVGVFRLGVLDLEIDALPQ